MWTGTLFEQWNQDLLPQITCNGSSQSLHQLSPVNLNLKHLLEGFVLKSSSSLWIWLRQCIFWGEGFFYGGVNLWSYVQWRSALQLNFSVVPPDSCCHHLTKIIEKYSLFLLWHCMYDIHTNFLWQAVPLQPLPLGLPSAVNNPFTPPVTLCDMNIMSSILFVFAHIASPSPRSWEIFLTVGLIKHFRHS